MAWMQRSLRQKVIAGAAVAVLLAGGALAAVSATGQTNAPKTRSARLTKAAQRHASRELATAAGYLGRSSAQISSELRSGKTLAQIAAATPGKSEQGLIDALVAAKKVKLAAAAATLPRRASAEVNRVAGPLRSGPGMAGGAGRVARLFADANRPGSVAASYLGLTASQLQGELQAGRTLAQIAEATAGKSRAGLIQALVTAKSQKIAHAAAAAKLSTAKLARRQATLGKRMGKLVDRKFAGRTAG
jgi:hypothetical protein